MRTPDVQPFVRNPAARELSINDYNRLCRPMVGDTYKEGRSSHQVTLMVVQRNMVPAAYWDRYKKAWNVDGCEPQLDNGGFEKVAWSNQWYNPKGDTGLVWVDAAFITSALGDPEFGEVCP